MPERFYAATGGSQLSRQLWAMITQVRPPWAVQYPSWFLPTSSRPPLPFDSPALCPLKCYLWVLKVNGVPEKQELREVLAMILTSAG